MSYAQDNDDIEQSAQGESVNQPKSKHAEMCEYFGYSEEEFAMLSNNQRAQMRWNWKAFGRIS